MDELKKIIKVVTQILKKDREAQKKDTYLIKEVVREMYPEALKKPFEEVLDLMECKVVPKFESIRRTRQKVQHDNPELKDLSTALYREKEEPKYVDFTRC